ncbi:MAG: hypothetical protein V5A44_07675 [Haloarculaceae archaeon]
MSDHRGNGEGAADAAPDRFRGAVLADPSGASFSRSAAVVTRVTVVQLLRKQRSSPLLVGVVVGFNAFVGAMLVGLTGTGTYDLGRSLAASPGPVGDRIRRAVLAGVVLVSVMQVLGAASDGTAKHRRVGFLTATSTAAVVVALLVRRSVGALVLFGPAVLAAATAFAVGAGVPTSALSLGVGGLWLLVVTAVVTLPFGLVANWFVVGYDLSSNARAGLGVVVLGVFYLVLFGREGVAAALGVTPVAWAGDLFLLTVPGVGASLPRAAGFAAGSVAIVAVAGAACVELAELTWYSDPVFGDPDGGADAGSGEPPTVETFGSGLHRVCSPRTAALVALTWRRTRRTPKVLFYVYPSALIGLVMAEQLVLHGPFSIAMSPAIVGFTGATAVGSGFTLNPLGTEGDALPAVLTAGAGSERFVRAKALAAALPGGPLVVGATAGVGVAFGALPPAVFVATLAYALALVALAPVFSQALGIHYPPDHEELMGGSVKVPDKSASFLYTVGMTAVALPGFAGIGQYALAGTFQPVVLLGGVGVSLLIAGALAALSYRHATRKFRAYSVE